MNGRAAMRFAALLSLLTLFAPSGSSDTERTNLTPPRMTNSSGRLQIDNSGRAPQGIAVADFNRDGRLDLAVSFSADDAIRWYHGAGDGSFEFAGERGVGVHDSNLTDQPRQLIADDFDADGFVDLAVVNSGNTEPPLSNTRPSVGILYGAPTVGFEPFEALPDWDAGDGDVRFPLRMVQADINGDRRLDLVVAHFDARSLSVFLATPVARRWESPRLATYPRYDAGPSGVAAADLDRDGRDDLAVVFPEALAIARAEGESLSAARELARGDFWTAAAWGDFDANGELDLAATDGARNTLSIFYHVTVEGEFERRVDTPMSGDGPVFLTRGDFNRDGLDDLATLYNLSDGAQYFLGVAGADAPRADRMMPTAFAPRDCAIADFNGDFLPDMAVAHEGDFVVDAGNDDLRVLPGEFATPDGRLVLTARHAPAERLPSSLERPTGLAYDSLRRALWTIDRGRRRIVRLTTRGAAVLDLPFELFPAAELQDPADIAIDNLGDLWVADRLGGRVARLTPSGLTLELIDTRQYDIERPVGVAYDAARNRLYVSADGEDRVMSIPLGEGEAKAIKAGESALTDLAFDDTTQRLWGATRDPAGRVLKIDPERIDEHIDRFDDLAPLLNDTALVGLAVDPARDRLYALTHDGALVWADRAGQATDVFETRLLRSIAGMTSAANGELTLLDGGRTLSAMRTFDANTAAVRAPTLTLEDTWFEPAGGASDGLRRYLLDDRDRVARRFGLFGAANLSPIEPRFGDGARVRGLWLDPDSQTLCVGSRGRLTRFLLNGDLVQSASIPAGAGPPNSIAAHPEPGWLVAYWDTDRIARVYDDDLNWVETFAVDAPPDFAGTSLLAPAGGGATTPLADTWIAAGRPQGENLLELTLIQREAPVTRASANWALYR